MKLSIRSRLCVKSHSSLPDAYAVVGCGEFVEEAAPALAEALVRAGLDAVDLNQLVGFRSLFAMST